VLADVYDPELLSKPAVEDDILLTTHTHWDHLNSEFQETFPGKQLMIQAGTIEAGDVVIQGIPSAHNAGDALKGDGGTNYIYLIEAGGLRIAHFGDIGQDALTDNQIDLLGEVDVAITQLANPYSDMTAKNLKGIKLMEQLNPRLIIPTHVNLDSATLAVKQWKGLYSVSPLIELCASVLPDQTQILFLGQFAQQFADRLNTSQIDW
jgi:L-ascorbate metabolism protein UlaG (beta-lactamase superfamily)